MITGHKKVSVDAFIQHIQRKEPDLMEFEKDIRAFVRTKFENMYLNKRRYTYELFFKWITGPNTAWQQDADPSLLAFANQMKKSF